MPDKKIRIRESRRRVPTSLQLLVGLVLLCAVSFGAICWLGSAEWAALVSSMEGLAGLCGAVVKQTFGKRLSDDPGAIATERPKLYVSAEGDLSYVARRLAPALAPGPDTSEGRDAEREAWHFAVTPVLAGVDGRLEVVLNANARYRSGGDQRREDLRSHYRWRLALRVSDLTAADEDDEKDVVFSAAEALFDRLVDHGFPVLLLGSRARVLAMHRPGFGTRRFSDDEVYAIPAHRDSWGPWLSPTSKPAAG